MLFAVEGMRVQPASDPAAPGYNKCQELSEYVTDNYQENDRYDDICWFKVIDCGYCPTKACKADAYKRLVDFSSSLNTLPRKQVRKVRPLRDESSSRWMV